MRRLRGTALAAALLLTSCGSSLHARRFGDGGDVEGIPYSLPEASFVISESPATADKPTTYTVALALTPSTKDRYWVKLKPGTFTSTDLTLTLGSQGQLATFNGQATPALIPVVQAIGEFVVAGLGVAARAAAPFADTSDLATPGLFGQLTKVESTPGLVCPGRPDVQRLAAEVEAGRRGHAELQNALAACTDQAKATVPEIRSRLNPDLDTPSNLARLYATNDTQRAALELAARNAKAYVHKSMGPAKTDYEQNDSQKKKDTDRIEEAIKSLSKPDVAAVKPSSPASNPEDAKKLKATLKLVKEIAVRTIDERMLAKQLELAAKLPAREWRNRHATVLEDRIDSVDRQLAFTPTDPALLGKREKLQREWAVTADGLSEFERARVLRAILVERPSVSLPPLGAGSQQSKLSEYVIARTELDNLATTLAQKRQALKPAPAAVPKPQPRDIRVMPEWRAASLDADSIASIAEGLGSPEFMVVVERGVKP